MYPGQAGQRLPLLYTKNRLLTGDHPQRAFPPLPQKRLLTGVKEEKGSRAELSSIHLLQPHSHLKAPFSLLLPQLVWHPWGHLQTLLLTHSLPVALSPLHQLQMIH